jgi:hypothetical protein
MQAEGCRKGSLREGPCFGGDSTAADINLESD